MSDVIEDQLLARARKAVPNQGLTGIVVMAAKQHRFAIEYIEQAPVLVIGATFGSKSKKLTLNETAYIAWRFRRIEGMKLKAAMAEFHLPYPLRKLRSTAIAPSFAFVIWQMRTVPPSSLSQSIPEKVNHQRAWLNAVNEALTRAVRRGRVLPQGAMEWLVTRLGGATPTRYSYRQLGRHAADIADMLTGGRFNPVWTFDEAINAHARWAADQAKRESLSGFVAKYGVDLDHEVDYSPQPNAAMMIEHYEIVPLRSGDALIEEGAFMRHCVPTYMRDILDTKSCLYSIRTDGKRVATLEVSSGYAPVTIQQLKGPCNAAVTKAVMQVAQEFAAKISVKPKSPMDVIKGMFRK